MGSVLVAAPAGATFPGQEGNIVWASNTEQTGPSDPVYGDIFLSSPDGTGVVNLTQTPNDSDMWPAISPDGNTVAFSSDRNGNMDLFLMDLETLSVSPLPATDADEGWSAFSPDGSELAYAEISALGWTIKVLDLASGTKRTLEAGWHPNWSPDGSEIAYVGPGDGGNEVYVVDSQGGTPDNLTDSPNVYEFAPDWSPDGGSIIYSSDEGTMFEDVNLWIVDAGGVSAERVTDLAGWESEPGFSPEGDRIVFTRSPDPFNNPGGQSIVIANLDGSNLTPVYDSESIEDHPQWQVQGGGGGDKTQTAVYAAVKKKPTKVKVIGYIEPAITGAEVKVTYYKKKDGVFKPLQTKEPVTDSAGTFAAAFKRKKPGKCMVTADYYGNDQYEASGTEVRFKC